MAMTEGSGWKKVVMVAEVRIWIAFALLCICG